jgi:predicted signal transduction protein with EAL and GGDEF domain
VPAGRAPVGGVGRRIDRTFVADIDHDEQQRTFLAGMLELARHLGMRTVAEGVERPGQLRSQRCDLVQSNLTGLPADPAAVGELVLADRPMLAADLLVAIPDQGPVAVGRGQR